MIDLASLQSEHDKIDIGKLEATPVDLRKLSDMVKNELVKNTVYGELVKNVNDTHTTDTSNLIKKLTMTDKLGDFEKKTLDHGHGKYITTQEFNNLTAYNFTVRFAQAKLAAKDDIADFVKEKDFDNKLKSINKKVTSNKTKHVLVVNELDDLL